MPSVGSISGVVRKAMNKACKRNEVFTRKSIIDNVRKACNLGFVVENKMHYDTKHNRFNDLTFDHVIDFTLSKMKANEEVFSAGRGLYTFNESLSV